MNPIISMLMQRLQGVNPNGYQFANNLMSNGGDPEGALKQIFSRATPEQKQQVLNTAKSYRMPFRYFKQVAEYEIKKELISSGFYETVLINSFE